MFIRNTLKKLCGGNHTIEENYGMLDIKKKSNSHVLTSVKVHVAFKSLEVSLPNFLKALLS